MPGFIEQEIERTSRGLTKVNGVLLAIVAAVFLIGSQYWLNFFAGPVTLTPDSLGALDSVPRRNFVHVTVARLRPTGYREITATKSRTGRTLSERPTARYLLAEAGSRLIMVKVKIDDSSLALEGELEKPRGQGLEVMEDVRRDNLKGVAALSPLFLDATNYRGVGYGGLAVLLPLGTLAAWNLLKARARLSDKTRHPVWRALEKFGDARSAEQSIDAEVAANRDVVRLKGVTITPSWIIQTYVTGLRVARIDDIVWLYKQTGKATFAMLMQQDGSSLPLGGPVDQVLQEVGARTPWAAKGWTPELAKMWRENRQNFVAAVQARRQMPR